MAGRKAGGPLVAWWGLLARQSGSRPSFPSTTPGGGSRAPDSARREGSATVEKSAAPARDPPPSGLWSSTLAGVNDQPRRRPARSPADLSVGHQSFGVPPPH